MKSALTLLFVLAGVPALAAEGMWLPSQLPELKVELQQTGLELSPDDLTRLTEPPLNAVIDLAGCTASFVSPQGLVITNHHCAWGAIQYNSTPERNLMDEGFLAADAAEELPAAPGSRVRVTVEVKDVTERVTRGLERVDDGAERYEKIEERQKRLVARCEKQDGHRCRVKSFDGGRRYRLVKQFEIRDVRLVYAPAGAIGVFGGDIDNWMWPRHTGDFSFLRAYVGPDGKPADPAPENVPYRPKHWLAVSAEGVREDGFVMVAGYPGRTHRYRLSDEVRLSFEWYYPARKAYLDETLAIVEASAERDPDVRIKYASTIAGLNNTSKNYQGMIDGYARSGMVDRKRALESSLGDWIAEDDERKARYQTVLDELETLIAREYATKERDLVLSRLSRTSMLSTARELYRLSREREKSDAEREPGYQERDMTPFRERMLRLEKRFDPDVDRRILRAMLAHYDALPDDQHIEPLDEFLGLDDPAGLDARLEKMYGATRLGQTNVRLELMQAEREAIESNDDPFLRLAVALYDDDRAREQEDEALSGEFKRVRPLYMEAMIAFLGNRGRAAYPDANGSLRVTFGTVRGYEPRDGMRYLPFTQLEGITEKHTGEEPFDAPALELERIAARDHGAYELDSLGSVPVNFLSTVDTTGGNSGSPTLNGRGELVGLLFDGTYDSINADWDFNERTTRSIHVDIRYILWVMEKVDGASRVLEELGL